MRSMASRGGGGGGGGSFQLNVRKNVLVIKALYKTPCETEAPEAVRASTPSISPQPQALPALFSFSHVGTFCCF